MKPWPTSIYSVFLIMLVGCLNPIDSAVRQIDEQPGTEPVTSEQPASGQTGSDQPASDPAVPGQPGTESSDSEPTGAAPAGTEPGSSDPTASEPNAAEPPAAEPAGALLAEVDLVGDGDTVIGTVSVTEAGGELSLTWSLNGGWELWETQVSAESSLEAIPLNDSSGNPLVGSFPFKADHDPAVSTFTVSLGSRTAGELLYICAHADTGEQSAWAAGTAFSETTRAMYFTVRVPE